MTDQKPIRAQSWLFTPATRSNRFRGNPMSDTHTDLNALRSEREDMRRKRLLFQCWHRGTQENDLILGSFAETSLARFDSTQLDQFEGLLDCTDADLFDWIIGGSAPPPQYDHGVMRLLRKFCTRTANAGAIR